MQNKMYSVFINISAAVDYYIELCF